MCLHLKVVNKKKKNLRDIQFVKNNYIFSTVIEFNNTQHFQVWTPPPVSYFPPFHYSLWFQLCSDTPKPISCISCQAKIHHWQKGCWKSEISHHLNILTLNFCWLLLLLPSSNPSVASLLERTALRHWNDYNLAVVYCLSCAFTLWQSLPSKDF